MRYFFIGKGGEQQMRLSFSGLTEDEIVAGVQRLARLVRRKTQRQLA
jgi:(S)-3,5-dihydroxyphenylglycine transaminase